MVRILSFLMTLLILLLLALLAFWQLAPWKEWSANFLIDRMQQADLPIKSFQFDTVTLTDISLKDVAFEWEGQEFELPAVDIAYSLQNLFEQKRLESVTLRDIDAQYIIKKPQGQTPQSNNIILPSPDILKSLPVDELIIVASKLTITDNQSYRAIVPINVTIKPEIGANIDNSEQFKNITFKSQNFQISLINQGLINVKQLAFDAKAIEDNWYINVKKIGAVNAKFIIQNQETKAPKKSTKIANQKMVKPEESLMLPVIKGLKVANFTIPDIAVNYQKNTIKLDAKLKANYDAKSQNIQIKDLSINYKDSGLVVSATNGKTKLSWPNQKLAVNELQFTKAKLNSFGEKTTAKTSLSIPQASILKNIPLKKLLIDDVAMDASQAEMVFSTHAKLALENSKTPSILLKGKALKVINGKEVYQAKNWQANLKGRENYWDVSAVLSGVKSQEKEPVKWLPLNLKTKAKLYENKIQAIIDADHTNFQATSNLAFNNAGIKITYANATIAGGTISAGNVDLSRKIIETDIKLTNIGLEQLLRLLLEDSETMKATGRLSGNIPIAYDSNTGAFNIGEGRLHNLTEGILSLGKEQLSALPESVEQVKQVSELLKNFQYKTLNFSSQKQGEKLLVKAALKGHNPNVYEGAEVHLNINLTGDLIEAISSALGIYELPEEYLKGVKHNDKK